MSWAVVPVVSGLGGLLQAGKALLKQQALEARQVRVGGREGLALAPGVRAYRPEPAVRGGQWGGRSADTG